MINTHLHIDHVGWNTYLDGRQWVPTFPNARYLFHRTEWEFWQHTEEKNQAEVVKEHLHELATAKVECSDLDPFPPAVHSRSARYAKR